MQLDHRTYFASLRTLAGIAFLLNLMARLALAWFVPLTYKEAYFWEWSLYPSAGYLDHPPMVAWLISLVGAVSTQPSAFVLRLPALLLGTVSLHLIYRLGHKLFMSRDVARGAVIIACCFPVLNAPWFLILPDTPLLLFQLLVLNLFADLRDRPGLLRWSLLGLAIGLALLSKLAILLTLFGLVIHLCMDLHWAKHRSRIQLSVFIGLICFLPFLWWNAQHKWDHFSLQLWDRHLWNFGFEWVKVGEVFAEQLVAATPLLLPMVSAALFVRRMALPVRWQQPFSLLKVQVGLVLGIVLVSGSWITQTHPHWTVLAFPPAAILLSAWWVCRPADRGIRYLGSSVLGVHCVGALAVLILVAAPGLAVRIDPDWLGGPLGRGLVKGRERLLGFAGIKESVERLLAEESLDETARIYVDGYQISCPLSFTLKKPVVCIDAYTRNPRRLGDAQSDYISIDTIRGGHGLYLAPANRGKVDEKLNTNFARFERLVDLRQTYEGVEIGRYKVYRVDGFGLGQEPL